MRSTKALASDTVEDISRRNYGSSSAVETIVAANPNVDFDNLSEGQTIVLPSAAKIDQSNVVADNDDDVIISINGEVYKVWDNFSVTLNFGAIADTFSFRIPFFPDDASQREAFRPFSYNAVTVWIGKDKLLTGVLVDISPTVGDSREVSISGYSRCGVLQDVTFSPSQYPIEYNQVSLINLTKDVVKPFGLTAGASADAKSTVSGNLNPDPLFERIIASPTGRIGSFLSKLAAQQGVVLGCDSDGNVHYDVASPEKASYELIEGIPPLVKASAKYQGQKRYSHFSGLTQDWLGSTDVRVSLHDESAVKRGVFRPITLLEKDVTEGQINTLVKSQMGRNLSDASPISLTLSDWRNSEGKLFSKNERLLLTAESIMIYKKTEFLSKSVTFSRSSTGGKVANLSLALPENYGGNSQDLPWEE
ncbi:phage baseplate assembly protein [Vibrio parahaemolyticus]|uniref:phage baseplate assembly protein n=1 Tax=Vibrio parahaemolyticus TaxID=670 RepID=UPI00226B5529|nr:LysM peptidoglycan-binding domain-containing protein [Vibrio parahaemolyticus]MCX8816963.1 LysM peptidoglycan-binding domain-containing protein [Vibrio parahaemolyticus]MDF4579383.1 LysM peptidoglycan-binding domain-containing protein [Vibrio parahaemolyticus]